MKTLTFVLYFVAILGLIEANWRVIDDYGNSNFDNNDKQNFLRYARSAMSQRGRYSAKMRFLTQKMESNFGGYWHRFYGVFAAHWRSYKSITVQKAAPNEIFCFQRF